MTELEKLQQDYVGQSYLESSKSFVKEKASNAEGINRLLRYLDLPLAVNKTESSDGSSLFDAYGVIIIELLEKIETLEDKVERLEEKCND